MVAANPVGMTGLWHFVEKLCASNEHLRVLDIHNTNLEPEQEEQILAKLTRSSKVELCGSFCGRSDHRLRESARVLDMDTLPVRAAR
jgi:hypothetical protein